MTLSEVKSPDRNTKSGKRGTLRKTEGDIRVRIHETKIKIWAKNSAPNSLKSTSVSNNIHEHKFVSKLKLRMRNSWIFYIAISNFEDWSQDGGGLLWFDMLHVLFCCSRRESYIFIHNGFKKGGKMTGIPTSVKEDFLQRGCVQSLQKDGLIIIWPSLWTRKTKSRRSCRRTLAWPC